MRMRRLIVIALVLFALGTQYSWAHEDFRVIGTVTKHEGQKLEVRARTGKTTVVRLDKQTQITQDKKKVDASALTAGRSVVVDAYGDDETDLLALEIRIVPPIAAR